MPLAQIKTNIEQKMNKSKIEKRQPMWALVQVLPIKHNKFWCNCYELQFVQRHCL